MSKVEEWKKAGFSDEEIQSHIGKKREEYLGAGFTDVEVDKHFGIVPKPTEPVPVNGTFYVGWRQYKPYTMNMGLDKNSVPDSPVMFYNLGSWISSEAPGMVLLSPFLYEPSTGIDQAVVATEVNHFSAVIFV